MRWRPSQPSPPPAGDGPPLARRRRRDLLLLAAGGAGLALLVQQADHLAAAAYNRVRPRLERQLGQVLGHPLELGPYQGFGPLGLRVGPSRLRPVAGDRSSAAVSGLTVSLDALASLRQRLPVLGLGIAGARVELHRQPTGGFWSLGRLPPGRPPRLELRLQLLSPAQLAITGLAPGGAVLRLEGTGRSVLRLHHQQLEAQVQARLPAHRGSLQLEGRGDWHQRHWRGSLRSTDLDLAATAPWLGRVGPLAGRARGLLTLDWSQRGLDCRGGLMLNAVRWQPPAGREALRLAQVPLSCRGDRLAVAPSRWRYGPWGGSVAASGRPASGFELEHTAALPGLGQRRPLAIAARGRWRQGQLAVQRLEAGYGRSRLLARGRLDRRLQLDGRWRLDPADLPLRGPLPPWLLDRPLEGAVALAGDPRRPSLRLLTGQGRHPLLGPWRAALQWQAGLLRLEELRSPHLLASASLPLAPAAGGLRSGALDGRLDLRRYPLARLSPLLEARLDGTLDLGGRVRGPLTDLRPDLALVVRRPRVGSLRLEEDWGGQLRGATATRQLQLTALQGRPGRINARLDRRWLPVQIGLERDGGQLELVGRPSGYRWQAADLPLGGLSLALGPRPSWRPLEGRLGGAGVLDLQPLAFRGRISLREPVFVGIGARQLVADVRYDDRDYRLSAALTTLAAGQLTARLQGRWNGPFQARIEGRDLTPLLARQVGAGLRVWRGEEPPNLGSATDLGPLGTGSLLFSIDEHLRLLAEAINLRRLQSQAALGDGPAGRLARLQARVDADLTLAGPTLASARATLEARGHVWLPDDDRDHSLAADPVTLRLEGPLRGRGSLDLGGVPLALLALLTPVPPGLRGQLALSGVYDLSGRRPRLGLDLALAGAGVGDTGIDLQRGRLELADNRLQVDLAALGDGASDPIEVLGTIPLEPQRPDLELRVSSRGSGLRFLTAIPGQALKWRKGSTDLQLLVRGSLAAPIANGFLRVIDGECRFIDQDVRDLQATVVFDFEQLVVQQFSGRVGPRGRISGSGS
ncbi:MAG: hypothetical protein ACKOPN_05745, partial [Prochlorococcaceae cyanobacterium]